MAALKTRRRTRVVLILALLFAGALWLVLGRRATPPTDFGTAVPVASLPEVALPFELPEDLHYVFGWGDVPAATLHITTSRDGDTPGAGLVVEYEVQSLPAIQRFWRMEATGRTLLDKSGLRPRHSVFRKQTKDKETTYETTFDWPAGMARIAVHKVRKGKVKDKELTLGIGLDFPAAFLALRAAGAGQSVRVVHGDDAYQVVVADHGRGQVELAGGPVEALHYEVGVRSLEAADDEEPPEEPGFSSAHVWLDPETHRPLRLEAQAVVGTVFAEQVRPAESEAGG
jgi:hypothetical protein